VGQIKDRLVKHAAPLGRSTDSQTNPMLHARSEAERRSSEDRRS
jgi:hypothetical protein